MKEDNIRNNFKKKPIEKHDTAPLGDVYKQEPDSKVSIPSELDVENAKDFVDSNEK
ncbi:DUF3787 domain-containing protein [Clostridium fermenticellae]|uniref:DUF3787 domain-containing protein n=1 Tax=Clostridium fermenticellae TaxID=2068654 RepID=A0A386H510_9CLOT|nr:DUF3787 domain-containing protein [Clostridium fermenticellae]AYD40750.1 DUF3787 domain-containing protein [Clostridium fermenticellae]